MVFHSFTILCSESFLSAEQQKNREHSDRMLPEKSTAPCDFLRRHYPHQVLGSKVYLPLSLSHKLPCWFCWGYYSSLFGDLQEGLCKSASLPPVPQLIVNILFSVFRYKCNKLNYKYNSHSYVYHNKFRIHKSFSPLYISVKDKILVCKANPCARNNLLFFDTLFIYISFVGRM